MNAAPGDRLIVRGRTVGRPDRECEVLEAHGEGGGPPFLVRWADDGHEGVFFPGADTVVEHIAQSAH